MEKMNSSKSFYTEMDKYGLQFCICPILNKQLQIIPRMHINSIAVAKIYFLEKL